MSSTARTLAVAAVGMVAANRLALAPPAMPSNQIDPGWQLALNDAVLRGRVFGHDVIFNFGPLGFLHLPMFDPALYGWCVLFGLCLAAVVALDVGVLARRAALPALPAALWGIALVLLAAPDPDGRFYLLLLLAAFVGLDGARPAPRGVLLANVVVLAAVSLAKFSHAVGIAVLVVLLALRSGPGVAAAWLGTMTLLWLAAGQPLGAIPSFVRGSVEIASGYAESVVADGPIGEITGYLVGAAALLGLLVGRAWRTRRPWRAVGAAFVALQLAVILRHAFTLHLYHALTGFVGLMLASVLAAGAAWDRRRPRLGLGFVAVALAAVALAGASRFGPTWAPLLGPRGLVRETIGHLPRLAGAANGWAAERAAWTAARQRLADDDRLDVGAASVDVVGWQTAIALTADRTWRPKPVFQSYAAATPALAARNAQHVAEAGADVLVADLTTIGERPPLLDTGPTLLAILRHYAVAEMPGRFLVLRRRAEARAVELEPLGRMTARLGEPVDVPAIDAPVWVQLRVGTTALGRIRRALWKLPRLRLAVTLADGSTRTWTIFPGMTASGFLLSPLVLYPNGLAAVLTGDADIGRAYAVRRFTVQSEAPGWYADPIDVELAAVRFAPDAVPAPAATSATAALPLGLTDGVQHAHVGLAADGALRLDGAPPGATVTLPFVAPARADLDRWLDVGLALPQRQEVLVYVRRAGERFDAGVAMAFQLSPGAHRLRVPLPISTVPVQVRLDVGDRRDVRLIEVREGSAPGVDDGIGWLFPFPRRWRATEDRTRFYEQVADGPARGEGASFALDQARALAGPPPRLDGGGLTIDVGAAAGSVLLGRVAPAAKTRRVLEMRLVASRPIAARVWWAPDGARWREERSIGLLLDGRPRVVRVPIMVDGRGLDVRLDVVPGAPATVQVSEARLLPLSAVAEAREPAAPRRTPHGDAS